MKGLQSIIMLYHQQHANKPLVILKANTASVFLQTLFQPQRDVS
jgi:hypothetical protein